MGEKLSSLLRAGGTKVGDILPFPSGNPIIQRGSEEWLRTGILASASSYPLLAALPHARVYGSKINTAVAGSLKCKTLVGNGSGTWLSVDGDGSYQRSTDDGVTWANHSGPGVGIHDLVFTGTMFVGCGADGTNLYYFTSATGASGSWTVSAALAVASHTAGKVRMLRIPATGRIVIVAAVAGAGNCAATLDSPYTGALTLRSFSAAPTAGISRLFQCGSHIVYASDATKWFRSTDGVNWVNFTGPGTIGDVAGAAGDATIGIVAGVSGSSQYLTSSDGFQTYQTRDILIGGSGAMGINLYGQPVKAGAYWLFPNYQQNGLPMSFGYLSDLSKPEEMQIGYLCANNVNSASRYVIGVSGTTLIARDASDVTGHTNGCRSVGFPAAPEKCGVPVSLPVGITNATGHYYIRAK